ncbi:hypothetical protein V6N12_026263 [Hibiscus sabdariffa]|uniref:Uncharacterized protein n=1 Tax=Hibiscus sabdariffa TaxID=183260 RepID=A0ABR2DRA6_9ROSI
MFSRVSLGYFLLTLLSISALLQHGALGGRFLTERLKDEENKPQKTWKENPDSNGSEAGDFFATINREVPSCPDPLHNRIQDNYLRMIWIKDIDMVSETSKLSSDTKTVTTLYKITKQWTNEAHRALVLSRGENGEETSASLALQLIS